MHALTELRGARESWWSPEIEVGGQRVCHRTEDLEVEASVNVSTMRGSFKTAAMHVAAPGPELGTVTTEYRRAWDGTHFDLQAHD
jgi:hypothetical protein